MANNTDTAVIPFEKRLDADWGMALSEGSRFFHESGAVHATQVIRLATLVELKLASGMTGGIYRLKDITDVVALIEELRLPSDFATQLNPYVRERFAELWTQIQNEGAPLDEEPR